MKVMLLTLALIGVTLLAGGGHGQTPADDSCAASVKAGIKRWTQISPVIKTIADRLMKRGGFPWMLKKVEQGVRTCICKKAEGETAADESICKCVMEMKDCDMMYKPNSTTPADEIKALAGDWMDCITPKRMAAAIMCREMAIENPPEALCMIGGVRCSDGMDKMEDEDAGLL